MKKKWERINKKPTKNKKKKKKKKKKNEGN